MSERQVIKSVYHSAEQKRVFDAVAEFQDACNDLVLKDGSFCDQRSCLRQMIYSSVLAVYGSSWVTDWVRHAMAGAAIGVYDAYDQDLGFEINAFQHEKHQSDGVKHDADCEVCIHIEEMADVVE